MNIKNYIIFFWLCTLCNAVFPQQIELYEQWNGNYGFTAIGNTLNIEENGINSTCEVLSASSATLQLEPNSQIVAAYLYWAGSGIIDEDVKLNGITMTPERSFYLFYNPMDEYEFFGGFANVTDIMQQYGNTTYTFSDFELNNIEHYCNLGLNFGGWAIIIVYENQNLPMSQLNIYDGFEIVGGTNFNLDITIYNLNITDNQGAKVGFLAWEGDHEIDVQESLLLNGINLSNPPLNPIDNVFNSTNSYNGSNQLWNMDLDFFDISNTIEVGDSQAEIQVTSGQDLVIINNIITLLRSVLPDATIEITSYEIISCSPKQLIIDYTVFNTNSTDVLPENTPIAFYINDSLISTSQTLTPIAIGASESQSFMLELPEDFPANFQLTASVDDIGNFTGIVNEINEDNNTHQMTVNFVMLEPIALQNLYQCAIPGDTYFDLNQALLTNTDEEEVAYFHTQQNAINNINPINNPQSYESIAEKETIFVRIATETCHIIDSFDLETIPLYVNNNNYQNINPIITGVYGSQTVTLTNSNNGNYIYSLEGLTGPFTSNPVFDDMPGGIYTVFIVDLDNCGYLQFKIYLLDFMPFFTPNNDGYNDYWQIIGWDYGNVQIQDVFIFDRYGKLIHRLDFNSPGWDGTYKGNPLPSSDYWFKAVFSDGSVFRGHFTMKR
ncbi:MAG TPA: T9SS type B sorting domain-containing protein [Flavobacteriaceae bacterium]|nr:T9SS type B sorting domain-containing protein [Flavobacteriaceae bacterium]